MMSSHESLSSGFSAAKTSSDPISDGLIGPLPTRFKPMQGIPSFSTGLALSKSVA
jgi:hypothetical protein